MNVEIVLGVISLISTIVSGILLYKTNRSKDRIQADTNKIQETTTLLEAESKFRSELMSSIEKLQTQVDKLEIENRSLRNELSISNDKIDELSFLLSEKINKIHTIAGFLRHMPNPAWLQSVNPDGTFKISFVNSQYCYFFNVSEDYAIGGHRHPCLSVECEEVLDKLIEKVLKYKTGIKSHFPINNGKAEWSVLKFPVIEDGVVVGIGGILVDCGV